MTPITLVIDRARNLGKWRHRAECQCPACSSPATRLWSRVVKTDGCWLWQGSVGSHGYGMVTYYGTQTTAHRVAYILTHGDIPPEMVVCHSCDVRRCVNPAHLWLGTQKANVRDAMGKGRNVLPPNVGMTHCSQGHEFTPANTYTYIRRGMTCRNCRSCQRERMRLRRARGVA
jgi:hypothetical protein